MSPTAEGFRTIFRRPSFALAEIMWRWVFGAAATTLLVYMLYEYLRTLPVSSGDLLFLRTGHPLLVSQALAHILAGSALRLVKAFLVVVPCLAILWITAASFGRAVTLRPLLEHFQTQAVEKDNPQRSLPLWRGAEGRLPFGSLLGLNFLRAALTLGTVIALFGAASLAGFVSPKSDPSPGLAFLAFLLLASLVGMLWSTLNWLLSLAPIFVVRDAEDTFGSLSASVDFFGKHTGAVIWSSTAFGLLHMVVFVVASSVVFMPTMFLGLVPPGFVLLAVLLLTMIYFAIVDFLYMGRLAAYVCILECPTPAAVRIGPPEVLTESATPPIKDEGLTPNLFASSEAAVELSDSGLPQHALVQSRAVEPAEAQSSPMVTAPLDVLAPSEDDILSDVPGLLPPADEKER